MNRAGLLRLRAEEELRGLDRVWRLLHALQSDLTAAQRTKLRSQYSGHQRELAKLERRAGRPDWREYADVVERAACFEREIFCYVVGRLLRAQPLDQNVGAAADRLLAELAGHACVEGAPPTGLELDLRGESLEPLIELVRLRFPGAGVWDLPVVAHEFGHYVLGMPAAGYVRRLRDVRDILVKGLRREGVLWWRGNPAEDAEQSRRRVEEVLADVFATYAVGPAYPQCCVALRVPPSGLESFDAGHPPWRYRVAAMIETLRGMSELGLDGGFLSIVKDDVEELWLVLSDGPDALLDDDREVLRQWVHDVVDVLRSVDGLMYEDGRRPGKIVDLLDGADGRLPQGSTVANVLNAAWKWRLDREDPSADELEFVAARLLRYCTES